MGCMGVHGALIRDLSATRPVRLWSALFTQRVPHTQLSSSPPTHTQTITVGLVTASHYYQLPFNSDNIRNFFAAGFVLVSYCKAVGCLLYTSPIPRH